MTTLPWCVRHRNCGLSPKVLEVNRVVIIVNAWPLDCHALLTVTDLEVCIANLFVTGPESDEGFPGNQKMYRCPAIDIVLSMAIYRHIVIDGSSSEALHVLMMMMMIFMNMLGEA